MPTNATTRELRHALRPMVAGAVLASSHPGLAANSIEIDHIDANSGEDGLGLRVFLYHPAPGLFEQWAKAIDARDVSVPSPTSRKGEAQRTATGHVDGTLVEVACVTSDGQWTWRTGADRDVHRRSTATPELADCGRLIVGVADPEHWDAADRRCPECESSGGRR